MPPALNPDVLDTGSPPIPEAKAWANAYDGRLGPLIDLSQAAPGAPPPAALLAEHARLAGTDAAATYGAITGDRALREAYAADVGAVYGLAPASEEIAITAGCNQAFVVAMMALARAGDRALLPSPWYFNHEMTLKMLGIGATPLPCRAEAGFVPDPAEAEALIDGRTRALVLVTPNNPTGAVYPPETIAAFAALCRRRGLWLVLDETYRDFLPDGAGRPHELFADPGWRNGILQLYSFSKAYAVPGWRLGAIVAGQPVIDGIAKWLDCIQICPARAGQAAIAGAIGSTRDWREANRREINARAAVFREALSGLNGWRVDSCGAYFAYLRHPFAGTAAAAVAERLVRERGVLALPGPYFGSGQENHLRVAVANVDRPALSALPERLRGFST